MILLCLLFSSIHKTIVSVFNFNTKITIIVLAVSHLFFHFEDIQKQPAEVFYKNKVFLKISQSSQENTCARVPF